MQLHLFGPMQLEELKIKAVTLQQKWRNKEYWLEGRSCSSDSPSWKKQRTPCNSSPLMQSRNPACITWGGQGPKDIVQADWLLWMGTNTANWNSRPELLVSFCWHLKPNTQAETKQKLQNAFAGTKNSIERKAGGNTVHWHPTQEELNYPVGKIHWYQVPKFHLLQRNFKVLQDSPRCAGCALLTIVSLEHEAGRYVGCLR